MDQFRQRLSDKAANATEQVEVIFVNPASTSRCCSQCVPTDNADPNAPKNRLGVSGRQAHRTLSLIR
ncbi:MAG: zinc ribbon domain-containing protein [Ferrimicrobium sp.]|uniref:zinc ribbon domain-containing protein n=1 Tax=Ferrimicrobium acidiphilum TaxID=121039 RepID=UPI003F7B1EAE